MAAVAAIATVCAVLIAPSTTSADPFGAPPRLVDVGEDSSGEPVEVLGVEAVSPNGRFATISDGFIWYHLDLVTSETTELAVKRAVPLDDGRYVTGSIFDPADNSSTPGRELVGTRSPEPLPTPPAVDIGLDSDVWGPAVVQDSRDGRYLLLSAEQLAGGPTRWFVYDDLDGELLTPLDGLPSLENDPRVANVAFASDNEITYFTQCCVGASWSSFERLDFLTGELVSLPAPADFAGFNWTLSNNRTWMAFYAAEAGIVDGLDDSPRLYRRSLETDITEVVPIDASLVRELERFVVADDGSIAYTAQVMASGEDFDGTSQLFAWNGETSARLVTRGVDGRPADRGIEEQTFVASSEVTVLTSFATDLADGLPGPGDPGDFTRRLYVVGEIPPIGLATIEANVRVEESARRCSFSVLC